MSSAGARLESAGHGASSGALWSVLVSRSPAWTPPRPDSSRLDHETVNTTIDGLAEARRRDRVMIGRALIVAGIIWMLLAGVFSFFLAGFGDCFNEADQACIDFHAQAGRIADVLPYLALAALIVALLALRFRSSAITLAVAAVTLLLLLFVRFPDFDIPFLGIGANRLIGTLLPQIPSAVLSLVGAVVILLPGTRAPPRT